MNNSNFKIILLDCIQRINGERTIYSIYHLLNGKKSSQTIQDAHLFQLTAYFGCLDVISREDFNDYIGQLKKEQLTTEISEQSFILTEAGRLYLDQALKEINPTLFLNGWKHHKVQGPFLDRLMLLVQVCSNMNNKEKGYVPITRKLETLDWVKQVLRNHQNDKQNLHEQLFYQLNNCLDSCHEVGSIDPSLLVIRLTGYKRIGLTQMQASEYFGYDLPTYHILFNNLIHYMLDKIYHDKENYSLLFECTKGLGNETDLTLSAQKTLDFINSGFSMDDIARMRRLKLNTIQDHIVEIALSTHHFDISGYVSHEKQKEILLAWNNTETKQLKHVREKVKEASYFEIRLVLARYGGKQ